MALATLKQAFTTDVAPILAMARERSGGAIDPSAPSAPAATAAQGAERPARRRSGRRRNRLTARPARGRLLRRRRPGRGQRPRVPGPAGRAGCSCARSAASTTRRASRTATCAGTSPRSSRRSARPVRAAARGARTLGGRSTASASTAGPSTTASSTPTGASLEDPVCYRDARTASAMDEVFAARLARRDLRAHGHPVPAVQHALPARRARARRPARRGRRLLLIPDLCTTRSPARRRRVHQRDHDAAPLRGDRRLGRELFAAPRPARSRCCRSCCRRHAPGAAAAGAAARARAGRRACDRSRHARHGERRRGHAARRGLGLHLVRHLVAGRRRAARALTRARWRAANFTNEAGAFGTVRFLKNVMGLWILEPCRANGKRPAARLRRPAGGGRAPARPGGPRSTPTTRASSPASMRARSRAALAESGPAVADEPVRAGQGRARLARAALRGGGGHDREPDRRARSRASTSWAAAAERLPEPGDRGRRGPAGAGGPRRSHRDRQRRWCRRSPTARCLARRGPPAHRRRRRAAPVRAAAAEHPAVHALGVGWPVAREDVRKADATRSGWSSQFRWPASGIRSSRPSGSAFAHSRVASSGTCDSRPSTTRAGSRTRDEPGRRS